MLNVSIKLYHGYEYAGKKTKNKKQKTMSQVQDSLWFQTASVGAARQTECVSCDEVGSG